jgi:hypothetical protein
LKSAASKRRNLRSTGRNLLSRLGGHLPKVGNKS